MTTNSHGERVTAKLSKDNWIGIIAIAIGQAVVVLGWGIALDRRVTKVEAVVESYAKPMADATSSNGILQRIDQSLIDIRRRLERLEDAKSVEDDKP